MSATTRKEQILKTKLYPPRLPEIAVRDRLLKELEEARSARLVAVVAGAGYGKSTLAAQFLQELGRPFMWYQMDEKDSDLSVFLSYLIAGLAGIHPGFGEKTLEDMASAGSVTEQNRATLSTLITELDQLVGEELFVALDDFHLVNDSTQIPEALDFLMSHTLPNLHFLVLSRSDLSLNLSLLRARRELLEISEADLSFTPEETSMLFSEVFGMTLPEEDIAALSESTEGWVSGLVLFYLAMKGKVRGALDRAVRESGVSLSVVFDFLSNSVYETLPEEVQELMVKTSILSRLNPGFCDELLGIDSSSAVLSRLVHERLFTIPLDDQGEWYRYHSGLKAFLQRRLPETVSPEEIEELHLKAAALWEKDGEQEQALHHYFEAESFARAADVLEGIVAMLVRDSRISFLEWKLGRFPDDILEEHPRLSLQKAQIAAMFGDYETAVATADKAGEAFGKTDDADGQAQSLLFSAAYRLSMAQPDEAGQLVSRLREIAPASAELTLEAAALESAIRAGAGDDDAANRLRGDALGHAAEMKDPRTRARVLNWCGLASFLQGRFNEALEAFLDADRVLEAAGHSATRAFVYALLSRTFVFLGRLQEARETAEKGIAQGESLGLTPMTCLCRAAGAVASAYSGDRETALDDATVSAPVCQDHGTIGEIWYAQWFLGEAYAVLGDNDSALRHLTSFDEMAGGLPWVPPIGKIAATACSVEETGLDKAIDRTRRILNSLEGNGAGIAVSLARSLLFRLKSQGGNRAEARKALEAYLQQSGEDIILLNFTADSEYLLPAFTDIFSKGGHLEFMDRVFSLGGVRSIRHLQELEKSELPEVASKAQELTRKLARESTEPLTIRMLGPFEASRGAEALSEKEWKSRKSLTILKYLAANRSRGLIPRDVLMELLWPDTTVDSAAKSLNAALSSARKTLEPGSPRGESSYIITHGDALRLELGAGGWIDLEAFREKLAQAGRSRELGDFDSYFASLKEAADLYREDFLAEDPYEDWCMGDREALRKDYIRLLVALSTEYLRRGDEERALDYLDRAIARDPGMEELYRKQMTINSKLGRRAGVEEAFKRCSDYLQANYGVPPSGETVELYKKLREA